MEVYLCEIDQTHPIRMTTIFILTRWTTIALLNTKAAKHYTTGQCTGSSREGKLAGQSQWSKPRFNENFIDGHMIRSRDCKKDGTSDIVWLEAGVGGAGLVFLHSLTCTVQKDAAYTQYRHVLSTYSAYMQCLHVVPTCSVYIQCLLAAHKCGVHIQ